MLPGDLSLDLYRGDTMRLRLTLWDSNNNAVDLTGVVAKSQIRDRPKGATIISIDCLITLPNFIDLTLDAANSHLLPPQAVWDLQLTYTSGDVLTPVAGQVTVTADVTDSS
jgi:hypothetical protein